MAPIPAQVFPALFFSLSLWLPLSSLPLAAAVPTSPAFRCALLPSPSASLDRDLIRNACRIGGLHPQFQSFASFEDASRAWQRKEIQAIAGMTFEQTVLLGGLFLPAYRNLRLHAVVAERSPVRGVNDLRSVTILALPDGLGLLHARTRGWKAREAGTLSAALQVLEGQGAAAALLDETAVALLPRGYRIIDLGHSSPVSLALQPEAAEFRGLVAGLESLSRTGYAARFQVSPAAGAGPSARIDMRMLAVALVLLVAAGLVLAQEHSASRTQLTQPGRLVLAGRSVGAAREQQ